MQSPMLASISGSTHCPAALAIYHHLLECSREPVNGGPWQRRKQMGKRTDDSVTKSEYEARKYIAAAAAASGAWDEALILQSS